MLSPFGDAAHRFPIPDGASRAGLLAALRQTEGVRDVVLAEETGCVVLGAGAPRAAADEIARVLATSTAAAVASPGRSHDVRVVYDGEDLDAVAQTIGKTRHDVIELHANGEYVVAMLGFMPGFAYLRGLPDVLRLPRRAPRARVPKNSVAIAADYSGIYPFGSPGGWHLLGRAVDFEAFGPAGATFGVGDRVRFVPADAAAPGTTTGAAARASSDATTPDRPHLEIVKAVGFGLLVDDGRFGHMHEGVPPGGPLIRGSFDRANAAIDNPAGACAVEVFGTLEVSARGGDVTIADGEERVVLAEGETRRVSSAGRQRVVYLAIEGGVETPPVLGSRSSLLAAGIGEPLRRGSRLVPSPAREALGRERTAPPAVAGPRTREAPEAPRTDAIVVSRGPDAIDLSPYAFRIGATSDRTGTRLDGPPLPSPAALGASSMGRPSAPMVIGAIELTPSGLIVLGPDHPTTGGYPVVGVVKTRSLDVLFAKGPGEEVRFVMEG